MRLLSNEILLDAYKKAIELQLDENFIELLRKEIKARRLLEQHESFSA